MTVEGALETAAAETAVAAVHNFEEAMSSPDYLEVLRMPLGTERSQESRPCRGP